MGVKKVHDPDSTYELTMDNVKKILAIYMRFRWVYILQKRNCRMQVVNFVIKMLISRTVIQMYRWFVIFQQHFSHLKNTLLNFRCDIPVVIMGETGCGKTRLVQFMCQLQCPDVKNVQNMFVMKVYWNTKNFCKKINFQTLCMLASFISNIGFFYTEGPWRNYKERSYSKSRRSWTCSKKKFRKRRDKPCLYCTFFWWSKHNRSSRGYQGDHVW